MQKLIKASFKGKFFIVAISVTIGIIYLSLIRAPKIEIDYSNIDKVFHLFAYFVLAISWLLSSYKKPNLKYIVVIACIIYGIVIEVLQDTLTIYRTGDYKDVLANTAGIFLGLIIFNHFFKKNEFNSKKDL